jgi:hypothetical protein
MAYVTVEPYFENTTMQAYYNSANVLTAYRISPCDGYVLHEISLDTPVYDEETGEETGEIILGYTTATISAGYNYDFEANPRQIYAVLESSVPADQIFGGGNNNDHEVMSSEEQTVTE